ncbi:MAG TPA: BON domain-containing protein [Candidatus Tectomicrobia bacterium]|nr:BON domain-containing protein [Candidatus Tectomicrobia bacterium]
MAWRGPTVWRGAIALLIVLGLASGCRTMTGKTFGENVNDKVTTAVVKTKLSADRWKNLTWMDVDTERGVVYLHGQVETPEEKQRAEQIAMATGGVERVVNNLQVVGEKPIVRDEERRERVARGQQPGTTTTQRGAGTAAASPSMAARAYTLSGEVTAVDSATGRLLLRTSQGDVMLQLPTGAALPRLDRGDRVTVQINPAP